MLYVLMGGDDYSIRQKLEEIKSKVGDQTALISNTTVLDGRQVTPEQLRHACGTVPFLAEKRLVIVEGLLERFESRSRASRKKTTRLSGKANDCKALADCIRQVPEFTILVLLDGEIRNSNPMLTEVGSINAEVRSFPLLKNVNLRQWIQQRINSLGGSISPQAVDLLARFVGSNLWAMANEIEKLYLFAWGRRIEEEDVRGVVSYAQEANVFAMVDAILEFKPADAEKLLENLLQQGAHPAGLLVMITRQARMLIQVKELAKQGLTRADIQNKLGLAKDFVVRKAEEQASKYSLARLIEVYHRLLEADLSIKTGRYDGELTLNILIAELCQRQQPGGVKV